MRLSEVIFIAPSAPASRGTLKSTRMKTVLFLRSRSRMDSFDMGTKRKSARNLIVSRAIGILGASIMDVKTAIQTGNLDALRRLLKGDPSRANELIRWGKND